MATLFALEQPQDPAPDLDARARVALGDKLLREFPEQSGRRSQAFKRAAARVGVSVRTARDCASLAEWLSPSMRDHVFGHVSISYSVLREAAFDYQRSGMPVHQRWDELRTMIDAALASGRERVTATDYRRAIGSRPIPNQADAMPPEVITRQLDRPEVWAAVVDYIAASPPNRRDILLRLSE
ncbi:hypothetical protein [Streptomyces sp. NPDC059271]|uniref:hypothetical protein n=1 Tax=Streptomyces sp. NPDC059271 TaxID=3346799 RepID=UPI0036763AC9